MPIRKIKRRPITPPPLDAAAIIAKKYRLTVAHARVIAELAGIGGLHTEGR